MKNSLLEKQIIDAKINFNYFFMTMIIKLFKVTTIFGCILLINQIFDILIINILSLIYSLITIYIIYRIIDNYNYILKDIKKTFAKEVFTYTIDTNTFKDQLFEKVVKYGK